MPTPKTWTDRAADILLDERNKRYLGMTEQPTAGLDVERLARAIWRSYYDDEIIDDVQDWQRDLNNRVEWYDSPNELARDIAREYDRER